MGPSLNPSRGAKQPASWPLELHQSLQSAQLGSNPFASHAQFANIICTPSLGLHASRRSAQSASNSSKLYPVGHEFSITAIEIPLQRKAESSYEGIGLARGWIGRQRIGLVCFFLLNHLSEMTDWLKRPGRCVVKQTLNRSLLPCPVQRSDSLAEILQLER